MKSLKKHLFIILLLYLNFCYGFQNDSIDIWIKQSKNKKINKIFRKKLLQKAYNQINIDKKEFPLKLSSIAYEYYNLKDTTSFFKINKEALKVAQEKNHTYAIGDTHWNYATYYIRLEVYEKAYFHFNKAYQAFIKKKYKIEAAKILWGMARIKGRYRDYTGSEVLNIKAIELFKELKNYKFLYITYDHLGQLQKDIKEYDKALEYYKTSLTFLNKLKPEKRKFLGNLNNIANIYFLKKKFSKALTYYNIELNKDQKTKDYARILDNRANCKLHMNDTFGVKKDLFKALAIRDSMNNKAGIVFNKIHISDYFKHIKDTIKAIQYAKEANLLAKEINNGGDYLTSLKQLAKLDTKNSSIYYNRYIKFNDSLISAERRVQNKFTRIEFETDEYIEETERLSQQRIWIIVTSIAGVFILSLLYFLRVQKVQNEKLSIEAEHQKANEEVYVLTLQQQAKLEEERIKERNRISEELHDGILGKLFGTRFGLGFLPIKGEEQTLEKHQSLLNELQDIEKEIRDVSHKLSDNFSNSDINFTSIIKQLLEDKGVIGNFTHNITFSPDIVWKDINEITKANIYRIIQEALQNIIKHAKAKNVILDFSLKNQDLVIKIKDNGVGFNSKKGKKGIGLKNIKTRIEKLKGSIEIKSEINVGTTLLINTPYIQKDGKKTINRVNN
ncbi:tetratricopeptide repeat-containing sensor histidine kinase [uncultured Tenacibaculum sp.]|uniref:tetratricopeptide repeat-containing sensor histidine kinase n=1 Tax=uncultured Tenacibaculum sp. TaxID=174713 RepID=UPI0026321434|nr:tetratricopeptide repeat-containing sensor histidine kinase [uncultured Tenacibaculum sp.]